MINHTLTAEQRELLNDVLVYLPDDLMCPYEKEQLCDTIDVLWDATGVKAEEVVEYGSDASRGKLLTSIMLLEYSLMSLGMRDKDIVYIALINTIANTISSIEVLANQGYDYQAISLIRNLLEQYMTLIIVTVFPEKRKIFVQSSNSPRESREAWHKHFTKTRFKQLFKEYGFRYEGLAEAFNAFVDEAYGDLSSFSHNDFLHALCYQMSAGDENEIHHINLFGNYVSRRQPIYNHLNSVVWPCHLLFMEVLDDPTIKTSLDTILCNAVPSFVKRSICTLHVLDSVMGGQMLAVGEEGLRQIVSKLRGRHQSLCAL